MSNPYINAAISCDDLKTPTEAAVMMALANFSNKMGQCWPSVDTLARIVRVSESTIRRTIAHLVERGILTIFDRKGKSNIFQILLKPQKKFSLPEKQTPVIAVTPLSNEAENGLTPVIAVTPEPIKEEPIKNAHAESPPSTPACLPTAKGAAVSQPPPATESDNEHRTAGRSQDTIAAAAKGIADMGRLLGRSFGARKKADKGDVVFVSDEARRAKFAAALGQT